MKSLVERAVAVNKRISSAFTEMGEDLAEFLIKAGTEKTFTKEELAQVAKTAWKKKSGKDVDVTVGRFGLIMARTREYLELEEEMTVRTIPRQGYKLATPREATMLAVRMYKSFLTRGARVQRILPLAEGKYMSEAVRKEFELSQQDCDKLLSGGTKFLTVCAETTAVKGEANDKA